MLHQLFDQSEPHNHCVVTLKVNELKVLRKSCFASYALNKRHFNVFVKTVSNERINKMGVFFSVSGLTLSIPKRSLGEGTFVLSSSKKVSHIS